ncbi:MAG: hypothetical protein WA828_07245 [Coleofasciculaceae cyanobacterium]
MKRHLKFAINVFASLLFMVSGNVRAAQADEVWLDFSVPEADVIVASKVDNQPSQPQKNAGTAKLVALDFSVQKADNLTTSVTAVSKKPKPSKIKPKLTAVSKKPEPSKIKPKLPKLKKPSSKPSVTNSSSKQVTAIRRAIIGQESAGKYYIVNPHSGALGYGQVMPENVAPWSRAALGREVSGVEFLNNPELQILVIDHRLNQYFNRALRVTGGDEATAVKRVAATWYSGNPNLYTSTVPQFYDGHLYPSIADYSQSVWQRYQRQIRG